MCLASWGQAQNGRGPQHLDHNGHGWDIRLAVPGNPGNDYPTLGTIPRTTFSCAGREPGYYADIETNCQVFRVCTVGSTYGFQSFLCPNGTLFNQVVFVCDWWMNVNCQNSEKLFTFNNDQFENLRLGPQLMKDIKKMLTHPMRNPYDKAAMKANVIVMQDYKPPAGQLFPNEALIAGPERAPNNVYVPKQNLIQNVYNSENAYYGSTVEPKYVPTALTTIRPTTYRDSEFFQRQIQYDQNNRLQSTQSTPAAIISNGHTGQFAQYQNSAYTNSNTQLQRPIQNNNVRNTQYNQRQSSITRNSQTSNIQNFQREQFNRQLQNDNRKASYTNSIRQQTSLSFPKPQFNNTQNKFNQQIKSTPSQKNTLELAEEARKEVKQDVVSNLNAVPSTIVTKIVPFSRIIQEPKTNKAKPRITVKTWIVKPTKSAKLIVSPTAYTYNTPTQPSNNNLIDYTTPYAYDPPSTQSPTENIISEVDNVTKYIYNNPEVTTAQTITVSNEVTQFDVSPTPSTIQRLLPTVPGRFDEELNSAPATEASRFYLSPSTRQPTGRLYLPPSNPIPSRQYLSPLKQPPVSSASAQLRATTTTPSPVKISPRKLSKLTPTIQPTRPTVANSNQSLPFTDILTKDKIDVTVNDIVTDTQDILKTASPPQFGRYRSDIKAINYPEDNFLPTESVTDSGESLTSQIPAVTQSSQVSSYPSRKLEPPNVSYSELNSNTISNLPYFKESLLPPANTIERTVTLRITIPEKLAAYLFRRNNQSDYNKLEIMNTGSSNYLVLSNNFATPSPNFIPLGRLVDNRNSGVFDSQALVFSLLADSINAAKEYSNYAQREVLQSTSATPLTQYRINQDVTQISNQISQLTASQFANNNLNRIPNIITPSSPLIQENQIRSNSVYADNQLNQVPQIPTQFSNAQQSQLQRNYYSTQFQPNTNTLNANLLDNNNQIYSGQLYQFPVPDVTNQIYNRPFTGNLVQSNNIPTTNLQPSNTLQLTNINRNVELRNQAPTAVQIVPSQTLPFNSAKLQAEQAKQTKPFNQESITNLLNTGNGISAQLRDRIVGTIPHPAEDNKLVTYEKDQSYYFTSNLNGKPSTDIRSNAITSNNIETQNSNNANGKFPDLLTFQFIPSVSYELEDKKEQQQILDAFQIDEFGAPRDVVNSNLIQNTDQGRNLQTNNIGYSANQVVSAKQIDDNNNNISPLYDGPSSYLAPQSSVGNLRSQPETVQNNLNSRLEDFDEDSSNGYPKTRPTREFTF
ncbi:hypothetical protein O3G_MSEX009788 [Manduca sexta]|uniref:Chitin-binding type-2 domain-containing protein n=1 Tax=Manduca sexta TaxID=7130 RepID=A0A921ZEH8_MANSE|nr:hypothetical protein O3G_MSEX009788 [Manduca sexta]